MDLYIYSVCYNYTLVYLNGDIDYLFIYMDVYYLLFIDMLNIIIYYLILYIIYDFLFSTPIIN